VAAICFVMCKLWHEITPLTVERNRNVEPSDDRDPWAQAPTPMRWQAARPVPQRGKSEELALNQFRA
jgi:hypothetical protein